MGLSEVALVQCLFILVAQYFSSNIPVSCIAVALMSLVFVLDILACG